MKEDLTVSEWRRKSERNRTHLLLLETGCPSIAQKIKADSPKVTVKMPNQILSFHT
jgi:hypothetical protein